MKCGFRSLHLLLALLLAIASAGAVARDTSVDPRQLGTIAVAQLSPEARATLRLIERGGPFPALKDGSPFGNRERQLPPKPREYYREYTVPTPGSLDRGARRIVSGAAGERYYTQDHYRSFKRIVP